MWLGAKYSPKFYLKKQDFLKHDFKRLLLADTENAYKLLELSSGVLRFEVTFRKFALDYLFEGKDGNFTYKDLLENDFISKTLIEYLKKLIGNFSTETLQSEEIARRLIDCFGKIAGSRRYFVYEL